MRLHCMTWSISDKNTLNVIGQARKKKKSILKSWGNFTWKQLESLDKKGWALWTKMLGAVPLLWAAARCCRHLLLIGNKWKKLLTLRKNADCGLQGVYCKYFWLWCAVDPRSAQCVLFWKLTGCTMPLRCLTSCRSALSRLTQLWSKINLALKRVESCFCCRNVPWSSRWKHEHYLEQPGSAPMTWPRQAR